MLNMAFKNLPSWFTKDFLSKSPRKRNVSNCILKMVCFCSESVAREISFRRAPAAKQEKL